MSIPASKAKNSVKREIQLKDRWLIGYMYNHKSNNFLSLKINLPFLTWHSFLSFFFLYPWHLYSLFILATITLKDNVFTVPFSFPHTYMYVNVYTYSLPHIHTYAWTPTLICDPEPLEGKKTGLLILMYSVLCLPKQSKQSMYVNSKIWKKQNLNET